MADSARASNSHPPPFSLLTPVSNPWGGGSREWNGDYSDDSPLWTDDLREAVGGVVSANDGVVWRCGKAEKM